MPHPLQHYQASAGQIKATIQRLSKQSMVLATLRLAIFVLTVTGVIIAWPDTILTITVVVVGGIMFLLALRYHLQTGREKQTAETKYALLQEEIERLTLHSERFDTGDEFTDPGHPYSSDLDLFGMGSIYQFVSRCNTAAGRATLAAWFRAPETAVTILRRQDAVQELAALPDWCLDFRAAGKQAGEQGGELESVTAWAQEPPQFLRHRALNLLRYVLPVITIAAWVGACFTVPVALPVTLSVLQLMLVGRHNKAITRQHEQTSRRFALLAQYSEMLGLLEAVDWQSAEMKEICDQLRVEQDTAGVQLRQLGKIVSALDSRYNLLSAVITNGLFLRDLHTIFKMEKWKQAHGEKLAVWIAMVGKTEALLSLGTLKFNQPGFTFPELDEGTYGIRAQELAHPLINPGKRVGNDLDMQGTGKVMLITGSNMAGKSTFLRTVGVNIVLALCGAPVCARAMTLSPLRLMSSMRIADSIRNEESTFFAELKKLKAIIDALQEGPVFILLDEILRGTNSEDKLKGSEAFIRQVIGLQGSGLVATHDLALAKLEDELPGRVINTNFEVSIRGNQFHFDYKLKPGICRTMNASMLMRQMGVGSRKDR